MLGTVINTLAILIGGGLGLCIKGGLNHRFKTIMMESVGLAVVWIGLSGSLSQLLLPEAHPVLFILSLVIGGILGEALDIEGRLMRLGLFLENRFGKNERSISKGFVTASLLYCVGSMAILGALESGIHGVHATLFAKSVLDGVTSIIFASTMGVGVLLAAISVLLYQGMITLLAAIIEPYLSQDMLREMSIIGGILITGLGLDLLGIKKLKIANLLPSIFIPIIYYLV